MIHGTIQTVSKDSKVVFHQAEVAHTYWTNLSFTDLFRPCFSLVAFIRASKHDSYFFCVAFLFVTEVLHHYCFCSFRCFSIIRRKYRTEPTALLSELHRLKMKSVNVIQPVCRRNIQRKTIYSCINIIPRRQS